MSEWINDWSKVFLHRAPTHTFSLVTQAVLTQRRSPWWPLQPSGSPHSWGMWHVRQREQLGNEWLSSPFTQEPDVGFWPGIPCNAFSLECFTQGCVTRFMSLVTKSALAETLGTLDRKAQAGDRCSSGDLTAVRKLQNAEPDLSLTPGIWTQHHLLESAVALYYGLTSYNC